MGCITEYHKNDDVALVDYLSTWRGSLLAKMNIGGILGTLTQVKPDLIKLNQIMGIEPKYVWEYSSRSQKLKLKNCAMIADYSLRVTLE